MTRAAPDVGSPIPRRPLTGAPGARWRCPWWVIALFVASLPAVTPRIYASDEVQYFAYLRSLWFDRDVSFENEYRHFDALGTGSAGFHETFLERVTETGRRVNFGTIGCALLWSPFYAVADAGVRAANALGWTIPRDGYSWPYVAAVAYGSAAYGFLAVLIAARLAHALSGHGTWPALVTWIGTPLLFYMYVAPPMSHACSAFAVAAFLAAWLRVRRRWSPAGMAALGALAALMAMVREQDAFVAVGPAIDFAWSALALSRRARLGLRARELASGALAAALCFAVTFLPQAFAYLSLNGRIGPSSLVSRKMSWWAPHAVQVLLSPAHGLLVWTPLAAVALAGVVALALGPPGLARPEPAAADRRRIGWCLLAVVAMQACVAGSVESWTVAGAFGQRRFVALTAVIAIGLGVCWQHARAAAARGLLAAAVAVSVWWNVGLMAQFGAGLMDRQRLEPAQNAWNTFVVIPVRAPELAWRYLFERSTFYRKH